ncbi:MAG TPA: hypothetical protein VMP01_08920 [Pirellulaceae bacterium]|nr:hypothetical protein [Pirellulaceae bacterium]
MSIIAAATGIVNRLFRRIRPKAIEKLAGSWVLGKAASDFWSYAIGLKTGQTIACSEITVDGEWITIRGITRVEAHGRRVLDGEFHWGRGLQVRIDQVAWCADCES